MMSRDPQFPEEHQPPEPRFGEPARSRLIGALAVVALVALQALGLCFGISIDH